MSHKPLEDQLNQWYSRANEYTYNTVSSSEVRSVLDSDSPFTQERLRRLLSLEASTMLEDLALAAQQRRDSFFGKAIKLFTPMYISNYCTNGCTYCAYKQDNKIARKQLNSEEIRKECEVIAATGLRHILVLTGEAVGIASVAYLKESLGVISEYFSSLSIEVYPMEVGEYEELIAATNLDGLTLYQETYNRKVYPTYHPYGKKADYDYRLNGPDRGCKAGIRSVTIGALLGLDEPKRELGALATHLHYLHTTYPEVELNVSILRLCPIAGAGYEVPYTIDDRFFAQAIMAVRILFPYVGITLSTREDAALRNGLIPLGITKISAGVSTSVGDSSEESGEEQFEISDERSVDAMCQWLEENGYQPVLHDWSGELTNG